MNTMHTKGKYMTDNIKKALEEIKQVDLAKNDYATKIMEIANKQGLSIANKVNHDAFYDGLVDYEYFRASAELLTTIILAR